MTEVDYSPLAAKLTDYDHEVLRRTIDESAPEHRSDLLRLYKFILGCGMVESAAENSHLSIKEQFGLSKEAIE